MNVRARTIREHPAHGSTPERAAKGVLRRRCECGRHTAVEMPAGVFSFYRTNLATSEDNLKVADIDHDDSADGLLERREFYHAWLRLCTKDSCRASLLKVY